MAPTTIECVYAFQKRRALVGAGSPGLPEARLSRTGRGAAAAMEILKPTRDINVPFKRLSRYLFRG